MQTVLISLSSFGAAEVRRHGQLWFARLAHAAGADGVEVRGELQMGDDEELAGIGAYVRESSMQCVYSSPQGLWTGEGALDHAALERGVDAALRLGAPRLTMSIGGFREESTVTLPELHERLASCAVELVIENDQTTSAGTLPALQRFLAAAQSHGLRLAMTFDMGNWHWLGECPLQAAQALGPQVGYVHCKGVQRQPQRWVAVPIAESQAPWRAVLRALPRALPWAIEYPLAGEDLLDVTRAQVALLRTIPGSL